LSVVVKAKFEAIVSAATSVCFGALCNLCASNYSILRVVC